MRTLVEFGGPSGTAIGNSAAYCGSRNSPSPDCLAGDHSEAIRTVVVATETLAAKEVLPALHRDPRFHLEALVTRQTPPAPLRHSRAANVAGELGLRVVEVPTIGSSLAHALAFLRHDLAVVINDDEMDSPPDSLVLKKGLGIYLGLPRDDGLCPRASARYAQVLFLASTTACVPMVVSKHLLEIYRHETRVELLARLSRVAARELPGVAETFSFGNVTPQQRVPAYVSAGHPMQSWSFDSGRRQYATIANVC